jgi:extracellular factor (EF) 3-hydroxypalmitic acid methyl ester biosynthesis protein
MSIGIVDHAVGDYCELIRALVAQGGPERTDYPALDLLSFGIQHAVGSSTIQQDDLQEMRRAFGEVLSTTSTVHGFAYLKPHGYAGDYELIDRIYQGYVSPEARLSKWDVYCNQHPTTQAVRNRKEFFKSFVSKDPGIRTVLNLGSGPGRDIHELFGLLGDRPLEVVCVDQDADALAHAGRLCRPYAARIDFRQANVLRFRSAEKFDLVFAGGVFDYFDDEIFLVMLKRMLRMVDENGTVMIGNFSWQNPGRGWMEVCDWHLHYRSPAHLRTLAMAAGAGRRSIRIEHEPSNINQFLIVEAGTTDRHSGR